MSHALLIEPDEATGGEGPIGRAIPVPGMDLDALDAFLRSDRSPAESMLLSDLDGLLTGIAVGPEVVMASEWMPLVWGGEEPVFADESGASAVIGGMMSRFNQIIRGAEDGSFSPVLWKTPAGEVIAGDWAQGFLRAIFLRPRSWDPLLRAKRRG
ncbi:MAG: UPF0149 family protein, partial [Caulobacteraceae bacterium]